MVLLVLPLCLPNHYAPLTKAKNFRSMTLAHRGLFGLTMWLTIWTYRSPDLPHPLHRPPQVSGCRPLLALVSRGHPRRLHLLPTSALYQSRIREPPAAGQSWRQIAQGLLSLHERRTTFGLLVRVSSFTFFCFCAKVLSVFLALH